MNRLVGIILIVTLITGCKNQQLLTREKLPYKGKNFLTEKLEQNQFSYQTLTWKADVDIDQDGKKTGFKINARLIKDTVIWMSISPALGIEVARVMLTPDSVMLTNKMDKTYFVGTYNYLSNKFGVELNFELIQSALSGKPIWYDADAKYKAIAENEAYMLQAKSSKKLARISGVKKEDWVPVDSLDIKENKERRLQRALEKLPDEASLMTRYWLEPDSFRLVKQGVYDFEHGKQLEISFDEFEEEEIDGIPTVISVLASGEGKFINGKISLSKIRKGKEFSLPFNIPDKYEPMD